MSRFGDLIDVETPVLLNFVTERSYADANTYSVLKGVAAALGDKVKILKIEVEKNKALSDALRIKAFPTFIVYKNSAMKWRQAGEQDVNTLINIVQQYIPNE